MKNILINVSELPENPITRIEKYLSKIAGQDETTLPDEAITRIEKYLSNIAGQETEIPCCPIGRIEKYLDYIVKNGGNGGICPSYETWEGGSY